jgi:CheY-like chemotaxis protein
MRILVVDDSAMVRETFRAMLEAVGHEVLEASCGHDAEQRLSESVDALIVDGVLPWARGGAPGPFGPELLSSARAMGVVAVLVSGDLELVSFGLAAGFPAFLKPPDMTRVLAAIEPATVSA